MTRATIGHKFYLMIVLNLVAAGVESIGILLFIPFLSQLSGTTTISPDRITVFLYTFLAFWDIPVTVGYTLIVLIIAFTLKGGVVFCLNAFRPILLNRAEHTLRQHLIALYATVDYRYTLRQSSGFFGNLVVTETPRACMAMEGFCRALSSLITISTLFLVAFCLHRSLSLLIVAAGGLSFLLLRHLARQAKHYSLHITSLNARLHKFLIQALQSFKYLKATARFAMLQSQLSKTSSTNAQMHNKIALIYALQSGLYEPLLVILLASTFYYSVMITNRSMGAVIVSILFFYRCMIELGHLHTHWQFMTSHVGSLEAVWTTRLDLCQHQEASNKPSLYTFQESIEFKDVSFAYEAHPILQAVNVRIPKNASIALVGASGAGKTTLVDLISGVLKPTWGVISIDQRDLRTLDLSRYRQSLGYVGQETVVFDDTIANNISMQWGQSIDSATFARIQQAACISYCEEFIRRLPQNYYTHVGERGIKLSGGQRQRLAIARELFKDPEILILDEATSSLDSQSEMYIQKSIERLRGTLTLVIISHRLSTIKHVDMICVLDQGCIIEQGTFAELFRRQGTTFRRMCELQRVV